MGIGFDQIALVFPKLKDGVVVLFEDGRLFLEVG